MKSLAGTKLEWGSWGRIKALSYSITLHSREARGSRKARQAEITFGPLKFSGEKWISLISNRAIAGNSSKLSMDFL